MEIQWLGHACFSIKHKGYTVVIDPYNYKYTYGYPRLNLRADKVLVSHEHYGHNCREAVTLSGKPESQCPFAISSFSVDHDHGWAVFVSNVVLHNQNGTNTALLRPDNRTQIGIKYLSSFTYHALFTLRKFFLTKTESLIIRL